MKEPIVYLDSSALVKRYVEEPGSDYVRKVYLRAYSGELRVAFSIWNVGEVLGVLDRARRTGRLDDEAYKIARRRLLLETRRILRHGMLVLVPLQLRILRSSWEILEKHHIYVADALQVASAKHVGASEFLTGDRILHNVASQEGLNSTCLA